MTKLDFTLLEQIPKSSNFSLLENIFINLKEIAPEYYHDGTFASQYIQYIKRLLHYRLKMNVEYICDVTVDSKTPKEEDILNFIVFQLHEYILSAFDNRYQSINQVDMTNNCIACSYKVKEICESLKIPCKVIDIFPGYNSHARLFGLSGYHYFNIATINGKNYLIDCSYKQFFKKANCLLEEIGVPLTCAPLPGIFMQQTEFRKQVANKIIKDGWIELNEEILKAYCDGFTLSYRNGLYYETFNNPDFSATYTSKEYDKFLIGKDNQINHEPIECLGPLKKILKKSLYFK